MLRISFALLAIAAVLAPRAHAGGLVCWIEQMERDGQLEAFAAELRNRGPEGLTTALGYFDDLSKTIEAARQERSRSEGRPTDSAWLERADAALARLRDVITQAAGQRDAHVSRLYWYTELEAAKQAAANCGKPILTLRLLGRLTDEYSCANSRFFRTALYANQAVSDYLRDNYILHWQSVRPVPRVTVDFGDGRKLQRTIAGNSAHYVIDAQGRPVEALPGLYGPKAFQDWLVRSKELADRLSRANSDGRLAMLQEHHASRRNDLDVALQQELQAHAPHMLKTGAPAKESTKSAAAHAPTARNAAFRAVAKSASEAPLLAALLPSDEVLRAQDDGFWEQIAAAHVGDARLDKSSIALIRAEHPLAKAAGARAAAKRAQGDPVLRLVRSFEQAIALDTVKNELLLHRKIHDWFVNRDVPADIDALNEKVYAELFLTPSSDPWLGLVPENVYTALDDGGLTAASL